MQRVIAFIGDSSVLNSFRALLSERAEFAVDVVETQAEMIEETKRADIVVTDMPSDSGLQFLKEIEANCQACFSTPIIILTSPQNEQVAVQALRDVATSYVPIRFMGSELVPTIRSVAAAANARLDRSRVMDCVTLWQCEFKLTNDTSLIGPLVRYLQESTQQMGIIVEPGDETRLGIALEEALHNSVYHGNLEVSSSLREEDDKKFYGLVNQRRTESPYGNRQVHVRAEFSVEKAVFTIEDEGPGFDISKVPDPTAPENVERVCGRGMLLMRTFMDEVEYNDIGNKVTLRKLRQERSS